jgi:hypothetical protein
MKKLIICTIALGLMGCGGHVNTAASSSSNPAGTSSSLSLPQVGAISDFIGKILPQLLVEINGLASGNFGTGVHNVNFSEACPSGGSFNVTGSGNLSVSGISNPFTGTVSAGAATVSFSNCVIPVNGGPAVTLSGSVNVSNFNTSQTVTLGIPTTNFSGNGSSQVTGHLSVGTLGISVPCDLGVNVSSSDSGTVNSSFNVTVSGPVQVTGTACLLPVNVSQTISLSF